MIFSVVLDLPVPKRFDYAAGSQPVPENPIGCRVRIPFGPRFLVGIVVAREETPHASIPLKSLISWVDTSPVLDTLQLQLGKWMAWRTACSEGEALFALLPPDKEKSHEDTLSHPNTWLETHADMSTALVWTDDQKKAMDALHELVFAPVATSTTVLLRGVAASGKTEVYFSAIDGVLRKHQNVLVLAPEVGLVLQLAELLKMRFGSENVAVWHGGVPLSERKKLWWKIRTGDISIVVGARSAVLLPLPHVGLFVLDEEHDMAWKEDRKPRFHARDVLMERARLSNSIAILSTATPTFEVEQMVVEKQIQEIVLTERAVTAATPSIELIDMNNQKRGGVLSSQLKKALEETISRKEQAILFINRRGFHRYLRCGNCEWMAKCPNCSVTLVVHTFGKRPSPVNSKSKKGENLKVGSGARISSLALGGQLTCHQCGYMAPRPQVCPQCQHKSLYSGGTGTERVLEELKEHMPWIRAARWDLDSVKKKGALNDLIADVRAQELDVLVGTQLVAQGFHFPHVTLVGVVDADVALYQPNFRAAEKTFQLLMQVAGRAGRDVVMGRVLIQTRQLHHSALTHVTEMDYAGFFNDETAFRRDLGYPPFTHLVGVEVSHKDPKKSEKEMSEFIDWVTQLTLPHPVRVLGPTLAPRRRHGHPMQECILKVDNADFDDFLSHLQQSQFMKAHIRFNVDPV